MVGRGRAGGGTYPPVEQRGQAEQEPHQGGTLVAADGLQLSVPLVLHLEPAQAVDDLETGEASPEHAVPSPAELPCVWLEAQGSSAVSPGTCRAE